MVFSLSLTGFSNLGLVQVRGGARDGAFISLALLEVLEGSGARLETLEMLEVKSSELLETLEFVEPSGNADRMSVTAGSVSSDKLLCRNASAR